MPWHESRSLNKEKCFSFTTFQGKFNQTDVYRTIAEYNVYAKLFKFYK